TPMIDAKGSDYVVRWPHAIADKIGLSVEYVQEALRRAGCAAPDNQMVFYRSKDTGEPVPEIAQLLPEQARAVVEMMRTIKQEIAAARLTHCRCCGLKLKGDECPACGPRDDWDLI